MPKLVLLDRNSEIRIQIKSDRKALYIRDILDTGTDTGTYTGADTNTGTDTGADTDTSTDTGTGWATSRQPVGRTWAPIVFEKTCPLMPVNKRSQAHHAPWVQKNSHKEDFGLKSLNESADWVLALLV